MRDRTEPIGLSHPGHGATTAKRSRLLPSSYCVCWLIACLLLGAVACRPLLPADPAAGEPYDVLVLGGEPEGVAAAVAAARDGQKTLLLVAEAELGGLFTQAMLNTLDLNFTPTGGLANSGIFAEFYRAIGQRAAFDVQTAKRALQQLTAREQNLTVLYGRKLIEPIKAERRLLGLRAQFESGVEEYRGRVLIDATADADLAAAGGVPYTMLREDMGMPEVGMGVTMLLHFSQVDWAALQAEAASGRLGPTEGNATAIWGFPRVAKLYQPRDARVHLRGLNIGRQDDGSVLINALVIFGVNALDAESYQQGLALGQAEAPRVLEWLRTNVAGFAQAKLASFPQSLYVRESRHMRGLYRLKASEVLDGKIFSDAIAFGSYPIDIQASSPTDLGIVVGNPRLYSIPIGCIVPAELENLLVVGRSASYDSLAAGSTRTVPVGMAVAQAAGVSASVMLRADVPAQDLLQPAHYQQVQAKLRHQGTNWPTTVYASVFPDHPATPALKQLVDMGLVVGGYSNDWQLEKTADERLLGRLLASGMQRVRQDAKSAANAVYSAAQAGTPLTKARLLALTEIALQGLPLADWQAWLEEAAAKPAATNYTKAEVYQFVATFLDRIK